MDFLLKQVIQSLREMKYEIEYPVSIADFDDDKTMGCSDLKNEKIIIAARTFDLGRREIAMTLMEEAEHINSKAEDESRKFQTHIFSTWLKSMEEANGVFL